MQRLTRDVSVNVLQGTYPICEKTIQRKDGMYISYAAMELGGNELLQSLSSRLSKDEKLKVEFDQERYEKTFEKETKQLEQRNSNW